MLQFIVERFACELLYSCTVSFDSVCSFIMNYEYLLEHLCDFFSNAYDNVIIKIERNVPRQDARSTRTNDLSRKSDAINLNAELLIYNARYLFVYIYIYILIRLRNYAYRHDGEHRPSD